MDETEPGPTSQDEMTASWTVVIPQKNLRLAKSRMALSEADRRRIVVVMFEDTLALVRRAPGVQRVIVVCDNAEDAKELHRPGIFTRVNAAGGGLNASVEAGAHLASALTPATHVAVLPSDLPGLRLAEFTRALTIAAAHHRAFVTDAAGSGTTLLTATLGHALHPAYGPLSRARHTLSGAFEIGRGNDLESLRDDVDDLPALRRLAGAGLAHRTLAAFAAVQSLVHTRQEVWS